MALDLKTPASPDIEAQIAARVDAAVAAKVAELIPAMLEKFATARPVATASADDPGFHGLAEGLAMAIAELNDQGTGRKRVAPETVKKRSDARERMTELIHAARARREIPTYILVNKVVLDEQLIEPMWIAPDKSVKRTEIGWPGVPNEAMKPLNAVAEDIFAAFLESIGSAGPQENRNLRVSPNGVVYMDGRSRQPARTIVEQEPNGEGVQVLGRGDGGVRVTKQVLGTWAAPAVEIRPGAGG